jgi:hypothetical protein
MPDGSVGTDSSHPTRAAAEIRYKQVDVEQALDTTRGRITLKRVGGDLGDRKPRRPGEMGRLPQPPAHPCRLAGQPADGQPSPGATEAEQLLEQARSQGVQLVGPDGLLSKVTKTVLESALEAEMDSHLGYERNSPAGRGSGNSRDGKGAKTVMTGDDRRRAGHPGRAAGSHAA